MKTLYFECSMGAAGDMLTSALLELVPDKEASVTRLNSIGLEGIVYEAEKTVKCGITGTHMNVFIHGDLEKSGDDHHHAEHDHSHPEHHHEEHHHHVKMSDIEKIVSGLKTDDKVKNDIINVYRMIAEAESHVHGEPVEEIHFHEVGSLDAIADVAAVCMLVNEIAPDRIVCSPVHVGSGTVKCAHGILPVPAPAAAYILKGVPVYSKDIKGELCTPTGAALLKYFSDEFSEMPAMATEAIGYGMGTKDFPAANCVRAFLGTEKEKPSDRVYQLSCNIDDMTGEEIGYAVQKLIGMGARDVFTVPVMMKKNRPGILLNVICSENDRQKFAEAVFAYTSTIGIREASFSRYVLKRREENVSTKYGDIRKKVSEGYGVVREKYEYDDLADAAERYGTTLDEIKKSLE